MAITKVTELKRVLVVFDDPNSIMQVTYSDTIDDPDDDDLPHVVRRQNGIDRFDNEGNPTDLTSYEQVVQDIAAVVWADEPASEGE
jgi:hypothetical protein